MYDVLNLLLCRILLFFYSITKLLMFSVYISYIRYVLLRQNIHIQCRRRMLFPIKRILRSYQAWYITLRYLDIAFRNIAYKRCIKKKTIIIFFLSVSHYLQQLFQKLINLSLVSYLRYPICL